MLNSASITQNGSKSTITSRRKRQEIISQWVMNDDSPDKSKTEERNGWYDTCRRNMTTKTSRKQLIADSLLIFFAASRAKLKRYLRPGPYPLTCFINPVQTRKEETEAEVEWHYTNYY
jgi:hypothetical protein